MSKSSRLATPTATVTAWRQRATAVRFPADSIYGESHTYLPISAHLLPYATVHQRINISFRNHSTTTVVKGQTFRDCEIQAVHADGVRKWTADALWCGTHIIRVHQRLHPQRSWSLTACLWIFLGRRVEPNLQHPRPGVPKISARILVQRSRLMMVAGCRPRTPVSTWASGKRGRPLRCSPS